MIYTLEKELVTDEIEEFALLKFTTFDNDELYRRRQIKKMSQKEVAEKATIARTTITKIENGQMTPSLEQLSDIADALDCSVGDLLKDDNDDSNNYKEDFIWVMGKINSDDGSWEEYPNKSNIHSKYVKIRHEVDPFAQYACVIEETYAKTYKYHIVQLKTSTMNPVKRENGVFVMKEGKSCSIVELTFEDGKTIAFYLDYVCNRKVTDVIATGLRIPDSII